MKAHFRRGVHLLANIRSRRKARRAIQIDGSMPIDAAVDARLTQKRTLDALGLCATEVATARRIADEVPEAAPALRAIVVAAAQRRARRIAQQ